MHLVKVHETNNPPKQTIEEEMGSLPEKEIKNNDSKDDQNLESQEESPVNTLEPQTEKK